MNMEVIARTNIPDVALECIKFQLASGNIISVSQELCEYTNENGVFNGLCKGIYIIHDTEEDEYLNGRIHEFRGAMITQVVISHNSIDIDGKFFTIDKVELREGNEEVIIENTNIGCLKDYPEYRK